LAQKNNHVITQAALTRLSVIMGEAAVGIPGNLMISAMGQRQTKNRTASFQEAERRFGRRSENGVASLRKLMSQCLVKEHQSMLQE